MTSDLYIDILILIMNSDSFLSVALCAKRSVFEVVPSLLLGLKISQCWWEMKKSYQAGTQKFPKVTEQEILLHGILSTRINSSQNNMQV